MEKFTIMEKFSSMLDKYLSDESNNISYAHEF